MNTPPRPGPGPDPNIPWYLRRPSSDEGTQIARPRPNTPPRRPAPPPGPPPASRGPSPPDTPWYLQRPDRPAPPPVAAAAPVAAASQPPADQNDLRSGRRKPVMPWLLVGAGGVAVVAAVAITLANLFKLGFIGGAALNVIEVQEGVLKTLSDPASGYGANSVTDVTCNDGHNPSAVKGTTFTCDATVNGSKRHVAVLVADDNGTYEVDGPR